MPCMTVPNEAHVYFAKYGYYKGGRYKFTHRDPQTGDLWGEDIPVSKNPIEFGKWVPVDSVKLIWNDLSDDSNVNVKSSKKQKKQNKKDKNGSRNEDN